MSASLARWAFSGSGLLRGMDVQGGGGGWSRVCLEVGVLEREEGHSVSIFDGLEGEVGLMWEVGHSLLFLGR